ncbi:hypothetical protein, partial [Adlercreutzia equolifaciens]
YMRTPIRTPECPTFCPHPQDSHNRTFLCIEIKKVVFGRFSIAWLQSPLTDFGDKLGKLVIFLQRVLPYNKGNYC